MLTEETALEYASAEDESDELCEKKRTLLFLATAINGETGELSEKIKKYIREDDESYIEDIDRELGDILWYLSQLTSAIDEDFDDIAEENIDKLLDRQERDEITGDGDYR